TPKATSSTLYFDSLTVNAGNGGFLHCIQMDTSVNAANQVVSVGADIAFDADPKFFACLVRFESRSEERFSRNAETDIVCRLLLEKKKKDARYDGSGALTTELCRGNIALSGARLGYIA